MDYQNLIVVGVDGTPGSRRALRWALTEASRSGAELEAVTVCTWDGLEGPMLAATDPTTQRLLVLGSHGHGQLHRAVLGSISAECARRAPCPVVIVPDGTPADSSDVQPAAAGPA